MMTNTRAKQELKTIVSQFADGYKMTAKASRDAYLKTLAPGARVPEDGRIFGDDKRSEFESACKGYRERVHSVISEYLEELHKQETEAPSPEAVNSITLLNMRQNITEEEVGRLLEKYGENAQAYKAIVDIAGAHDLHIWGAHPVSAQIEGAEALEKELSREISLTSAEGGHASEAFVSVLNMDIDNALSEV